MNACNALRPVLPKLFEPIQVFHPPLSSVTCVIPRMTDNATPNVSMSVLMAHLIC